MNVFLFFKPICKTVSESEVTVLVNVAECGSMEKHQGLVEV